jgi:hypothetical protein
VRRQFAADPPRPAFTSEAAVEALASARFAAPLARMACASAAFAADCARPTYCETLLPKSRPALVDAVCSIAAAWLALEASSAAIAIACARAAALPLAFAAAVPVPARSARACATSS